MKTVILSLCEPVDRFIITSLEQQLPVEAVIRPVDTGYRRPQSPLKKLRKLTPSRIATRMRQAFYRRYMVPTFTQTFESLFPRGEPAIQSNLIDIPQHEINSQSTIDLIKSLSPDVLLVSGAPLLKPAVFSIASLATLNIHFGIAPHYRGIHTVFWPLYYHDYEHLGVTIHHIDRGMDTGRIVATGRPEICAEDTEGTLWASCARVGAKAAAEALTAAEDGADLTGHKQAVGGQKFFNRDRKIRHDLTVQLRRRLGSVLPTLPERIETFFEEVQSAPIESESVEEQLALPVT